MVVIDFEPEYTLTWPRSLFEWEARRLLSADDEELPETVTQLLREAFEEADAAEQFLEAITPGTDEVWHDIRTATPPRTTPRVWLEEFLTNEQALAEPVRPSYWAQRNGVTGADHVDDAISLGEEFFALISELEWRGYLPRILPKACVDDSSGGYSNEEVGQVISRATGLRINWPISEMDQPEIADAVLFSLLEYFHDQAQRPRSPGYFHPWGGCGPHYANWNKQSGGVVYRWRVNQLLEKHQSGYRLSSNVGERGRLVAVMPQETELIVKEQLLERTDPADEVAHALRDYRHRNASRPQKTAALTLLAGELERRRGRVKAELLKGDEAGLFQIANEYAIRHRNERQRTDYGDEFLDWVFSIFVATINLIDTLERRAPGTDKRPTHPGAPGD